jgi:hypothetical protein
MILTGLGIALMGCAGPQYDYAPVQHATAMAYGEPAADYPLPSRRPDGDVELASFGVQKVVRGARAVHVRMIVANDGTGIWTVDTRQQLMALPGVGRVRPTWAYSSVGQPPRIAIGPSQRAVVDLFYPLPLPEHHARDIPDFSVLWEVQTDRGPIIHRTRFDRHRVEPVIPYSYSEPYGWYDDESFGPGWDNFDEDFGNYDDRIVDDYDDRFGDDYDDRFGDDYDDRFGDDYDEGEEGDERERDER